VTDLITVVSPAVSYKAGMRGLRRTAASAVLGVVTATAAGGCGGGSAPPSVASIGAASTVAAAPSVSPSGPAQAHHALVLYARCMRASGVSAFPDPTPGGGIHLGPGLDPRAPAFMAAQAKCRALMPRGPLGPGTTTHPAAQTLERFVRIAACMRRHGVPSFPDPRTSVPASLAGAGVISDIEGVILVFPAATIDTQSPTFTRAAAACDFPLHNR
jgi:hypothetical protein